jgi:hypothetical protein
MHHHHRPSNRFCVHQACGPPCRHAHQAVLATHHHSCTAGVGVRCRREPPGAVSEATARCLQQWSRPQRPRHAGKVRRSAARMAWVATLCCVLWRLQTLGASTQSCGSTAFAQAAHRQHSNCLNPATCGRRANVACGRPSRARSVCLGRSCGSTRRWRFAGRCSDGRDGSAAAALHDNLASVGGPEARADRPNTSKPGQVRAPPVPPASCTALPPSQWCVHVRRTTQTPVRPACRPRTQRRTLAGDAEHQDGQQRDQHPESAAAACAPSQASAACASPPSAAAGAAGAAPSARQSSQQHDQQQPHPCSHPQPPPQQQQQAFTPSRLSCIGELQEELSCGICLEICVRPCSTPCGERKRDACVADSACG